MEYIESFTACVGRVGGGGIYTVWRRYLAPSLPPPPPGAHLVCPECGDAVLCCVQHCEAEGGGGGGEEGGAALQHVHCSLMVWGELTLLGIVCEVTQGDIVDTR